ncbi:MAG: 4Fe-4S binding protein [Anaerolineae bacterium]|nr:4Fe-4S binding protein [Anaerolineae bacterium]
MPASATGKPIPRIDEELCLACRRCPVIAACRGRAVVRLERDEPPFIDAASCDGCYACIPACPYGAVVPGGTTGGG